MSILHKNRDSHNTVKVVIVSTSFSMIVFYTQLHKLLDVKELREFATLLKSYRDNMLVEEFLMKLKVLYGEQRAFLIPGIKSQ